MKQFTCEDALAATFLSAAGLWFVIYVLIPLFARGGY